MDWSDIGDAVKNYAPMVGMALSSPMGTAVAVGQLVANVFGVKSNPEDVLNYINSDPQKAQERLQYELANNVEFQKVCLSKIQEANRHEEANTQLIVQDKDSARKNSDNVNKSPVDNIIKMSVVYGFLALLSGCLFGMFLFKESIDKTEISVLSTIIGFVLKSLTSVVDFYWGAAFDRRTPD